MGGAYTGDAFENSLYLNPGQGEGQGQGHWITISLQGTTANRSAIGARLKLTFAENAAAPGPSPRPSPSDPSPAADRSIYRDLNSGGSFGSNPLRQHIGVGQATVIKELQITWPTPGHPTIQTFHNLPINTNLKITEGSPQYTTYTLTRLDFQSGVHPLISCSPR
jgi:hypothetical protein